MKTKWNAFCYIIQFVKPYAPLYILGVLLYASQHITYPIVTSILMGSMTNAMLLGDTATLLRAMLTVVGMFILMIVLVYPGILIYMSLPLRIKQDMQRQSLRAFMNRKLDARGHSGEYLSRFNNDIEEAGQLFYHGLIALVMQSSPLILFGPAIFVISVPLGLFVVFCAVFSAVTQVFMVKPMSAVFRGSMEGAAKTTATIVDICSGEILIKVFGLREKMTAAFAENNNELLRLDKKEVNYKGLQTFLQQITRLMTTVGVYILGSVLIARGQLSLPALMAVVPLAAAFTYALFETGSCWVSFQQPLEAGIRVQEMLTADTAPLSTSHEAMAGHDLQLSGLTFSYNNADAPTLTNVHLSIAENELVLVSGPSGCGKSTLLKLIAGLYENESLPIYMGAKPFAPNTLTAWRAHVSYVDQDCTLFNLSLRDNIGIGKPGASLDEIKEAARLAGADAFIVSLPDGYDTQAGELGGKLSGGQRQRITIARAILKGAPIIVLDEITSALDAHHTRQIASTIEALAKNHTIIVSAHDALPIKPDKTIHLAGGKIA